jgi:cysteine desulfurase
MIYFDNNSTTRVHDQVVDAMLPYFREHYGNYSSSNHSFGWVAKAAVEKAREQVAAIINCKESELIFTSGATESINTALKSVVDIYGKKRKKIISLRTEHKAVLDILELFHDEGFEIIYLKVNREGLIDLDSLRLLLDDSVLMVCIMLANNETGVLQPIAEISNMAKSLGVIVFCDATQAVGKIPVDVDTLQVDLMCLSAHKIYGPKGVGALYVRSRNPRIVFKSLLDGGGQETGRRSGTLNVSGIVGLGQAAELAERNLWDNMTHYSRIRNHFEHQLLDFDITINGSTKNRLSNTSNICFNGLKGQEIIKQLKDVAISMGSACTSESIYPSHVLKAMGLSDEEVNSSLRFSFGLFNTIEEADEVLNRLKTIL